MELQAHPNSIPQKTEQGPSHSNPAIIRPGWGEAGMACGTDMHDGYGRDFVGRAGVAVARASGGRGWACGDGGGSGGVCARVRACTSVLAQLCIGVHKYAACVHTSAQVCTRVHSQVCTTVHMCAQVYTSVYVCTMKHRCTFVCTCAQHSKA